MKFRILAAFAVLLLSAPSALGVQRALAPTRGELAGWLAAAGIELAYLSLAFATFADQRRQRLAARVARAAVLTAITLNVIADYAARAPDGLSSAAAFMETFDWLLLALSVLESAPLATLAYTIATLLHSSAQHTSEHQQHHRQHTADAGQHMLQHTADAGQQYAAACQQQEQQYAAGQHQHQHQHQHTAADAGQHTAEHSAASAADADSILHQMLMTAADAADQQQQEQQHTADAEQHTAAGQQHTADAGQHMLQHHQQHQQRAALSYRCPRCAAMLTQQQYGAARRYGYCAGCKGK